MSKHTPRPWEVRPSNNEIINADHGRLPFAIVSGCTLIGALYENSADARLIAAAPELLEALKLWQSAKEYAQKYGHISEAIDEIAAAFDQAEAACDAAISKATGANHE